MERAAQATLRVRQDRILTSAAHTASRQADEENQVSDGNERWPTIEEIRAAQEDAEEDLMQAYNLELRDSILTDSNNCIFVPAVPEHLRAHLMVIAHAGATGHRGQKVTLRDLERRFVWPEMAAQVRQFVRRCLLCCKTRGWTVIPPPVGKALRGAAPGESLHLDFITLFEGEGLLVL